MPKPLKSQWEFGELFPAEAVRKTLTVSELTGSIRRVLEKNIGSVSVMGEMTNLRVLSVNGTSYQYLAFNLQDPVLKDVRVRQAIAYAIDREKIMILPNTAACYNVDDAVRTARLGREAGLSHWVKLEVIGDEKTLFPDTEGLLAATRVLVKEGFVVLPYTNDDPVVCRKLEEAGAAAVMPLGAPIGSGLGIQNPNNIRIIKDQARVPVIVDAGVGTASDVAVAMELGVDGVMLNTAIALAHDPVAMATAMKLGVEAGRICFLAGRMPRQEYASPSSPVEGRIGAAAGR